jgi:hypothetical protein
MIRQFNGERRGNAQGDHDRYPRAGGLHDYVRRHSARCHELTCTERYIGKKAFSYNLVHGIMSADILTLQQLWSECPLNRDLVRRAHRIRTFQSAGPMSMFPPYSFFVSSIL